MYLDNPWRDGPTVRRLLKLNSSALTQIGDIEVELVTTEAECDTAIKDLREKASAGCAVGFDSEWVPNSGGSTGTRPAATVQLCADEGKVVNNIYLIIFIYKNILFTK